MLSIVDWLQGSAEKFLLYVLASGPIPQHVAFVMDGNRRYARKERKKTIQGHAEGFMALRRVRVTLPPSAVRILTSDLALLKKILDICLKLNIRCVSAYAFAIDNFKRSPEEVEGLMGLAEEKLLDICRHG
jgi:ditrans,polycis-polyprenyl diphosphate synthase